MSDPENNQQSGDTEKGKPGPKSTKDQFAAINARIDKLYEDIFERIAVIEETLLLIQEAGPVSSKDSSAPANDQPEGAEDRMERLEALVIRIAHNSGTSHAILIKAGLTPYNPTKGDMSKLSRVAVTP